VTDRTIDYDRWYPEVPAVLDTNQLADQLHTNEQNIRPWVREGYHPGSSQTRRAQVHIPQA